MKKRFSDTSFNQEAYNEEIDQLAKELEGVFITIEEAKDALRKAGEKADAINSRLGELALVWNQWFERSIKSAIDKADTGLVGQDKLPIYLGSPVKIKRATKGKFKGITEGRVSETTDKN